EDQRLAGGAEDVDREPGGAKRAAEKPGQLDAADAIRADLLDGDPAAGQLLREKIGRVAQAAAGDEMIAALARTGRQLDVGWCGRRSGGASTGRGRGGTGLGARGGHKHQCGREDEPAPETT